MKKLLDFKSFYLVGIKGVAMTSTAQLLVDADKNVAGCDVAEKFVTQDILDKLNLNIDVGFDNKLPDSTECIIYTSAHGGIDNPQVQKAKENGLAIFSQAQSLAEFFNTKKGIAVSGVGGKSTVSAMISWILEKTNQDPSFSVGVGNIPGIDKTGKWNSHNEYFVAEADEYVVNPNAPQKNEEIIPRFSYLHPFITICTNLKFDHPDVYKNFEHTKKMYKQFFQNIKPNGTLIINGDNDDLVKLANKINRNDIKIITFGESKNCDFRLSSYNAQEGLTSGTITYKEKTYNLSLQIPGKFNLMNALSGIIATSLIGLSIKESISAIRNFRSTMRRFEYIGEKNGVKYYDDYAHHPHEVANAITAINEWYPNNKKIIAFQSHTFSRTRKLFDEFVDAFANTNEVLMIDIFSSAREEFDPNVSSDTLCVAISKKYPKIKIENVKTIKNLAKRFEDLEKDSVVLTLGAGDIYRVFEKYMLKKD